MSNPYEQYPAGDTPDPYAGQYGGQYGGQPYGVAPQEHPQGTVVLVLGILGFLVGVTAPFAWYLGNKAMKEVRASGTSYSNEQQINIGRILGMVVTLLYAIGLVLGIIAVIVLAAAAANANGGY